MRLKALNRLGTRDSVLRWTHVLMWTMFTCIGMLPILVKLLLKIDNATRVCEP
jgi:hypothetical protein